MKRLIICCDGTWNRADQARDGMLCPTNVLGIATRIAKRSDQIPQVVYYDQGVGTGNVIDRFSGGTFGTGLLDNIHDAYRFLIGNYERGDEIFLFGFSRGAYTVRSLGGMIRKCGILKRDSVSRYVDTLRLYRRNDCHPNDDEAVEFRGEHSVCGAEDVPVRFIGVWDTVGTLGIPLRGLRWLSYHDYQFHDTQLSRCVQAAYHALAIDEHRGPFEATLWEYLPKPGQKVEQVWFCGAHSDVGGGYPESALANIALQWMMDRARSEGLAFDEEATGAYPLHPDPFGKLHDSKRGFYRLTLGTNRPIGLVNRRGIAGDPLPPTADPTQSIHESVLKRWDEDPTYRPANLREYFRRTGDSRGTAT